MKQKDIIDTLLFSNKLNEKFQPDDGLDRKFSSTAIFDRPGPNNKEEDILDLPIDTSEKSSNQLTSDLISRDRLLDRNYTPENERELLKAINSIFHEVSLNRKQISSIWNIIKKISEKVSK